MSGLLFTTSITVFLMGLVVKKQKRTGLKGPRKKRLFCSVPPEFKKIIFLVLLIPVLFYLIETLDEKYPAREMETFLYLPSGTF